MSAVGATKEVLLDQFRKLSEKEQHDHVLSLLELVEVRQKLQLNFSILSRAALFPSLPLSAGASAAEPLQQDTSAAVVRHLVPAPGGAVRHGALLPGRQTPLCSRPLLPQLESHGEQRRALVAT